MATIAPSGPLTPGLQTRLLPLAIRTRFRSLYFARRSLPTSPPVWACFRSRIGTALGSIAVGDPWPTWVFQPQDDTILTDPQLNDIILFIRQASL